MSDWNKVIVSALAIGVGIALILQIGGIGNGLIAGSAIGSGAMNLFYGLKEG